MSEVTSVKKKVLRTAFAVCCMISVLFLSISQSMTAYAASGLEAVVLNFYSKTVKIGDECYLLALTTNGKKPSFSSSDSKIASVNTYGKITAKKAGTVKITAKIKNGEASCTVTVQKTKIQLSAKEISLENGQSARLKVNSSTGHPVTFKTSKKSIAEVDENGVITAKKPGTATITATVDKISASCRVTVKKPTVSLSKRSVSLYRNRKVRLTVKSTSNSAPKWKSNKKSVATIEQNGVVTAVKNGSAVITVTVDGVSKSCEVTVKKPVVKFAESEIIMARGETRKVNVTVSSGNKPVFSSSNTSIASVDEQGNISANDAGKAYIYAKEDGVKSRMQVIVK
ncbi:hypothetical protein E5329_17565 [Petralouisia muris]|uniref:Uncharacterized protein n=1 Tax=Petralouisia muris TaxID=3032872 RepID=A0AC61RSL5_9FIRM|nr:Ig-like domain-containing protein [Petralouisia muris]TGY93648.1 hypothetical protein E5329_17565 [Petralouisia muris]